MLTEDENRKEISQEIVLTAVHRSDLNRTILVDENGNIEVVQSEFPIVEVSVLPLPEKPDFYCELETTCNCLKKRVRAIRKQDHPIEPLSKVKLFAYKDIDPSDAYNYPCIWIGQCQDCGNIYWCWKER